MHVQSDNSEISPAVSLILDDYRGQCDPGIRLNIQKGESFCVSLKSGVANIQYSKRVEVFRGLGILLENCKNGDFEKREKNKFDTVGAMIDVSRNAVLTVESVKRLIRVHGRNGGSTGLCFIPKILTRCPKNRISDTCAAGIHLMKLKLLTIMRICSALNWCRVFKHLGIWSNI